MRLHTSLGEAYGLQGLGIWGYGLTNWGSDIRLWALVRCVTDGFKLEGVGFRHYTDKVNPRSAQKA